jgi:DNA-binding transcriptional ArsR family regulator
MNDSGGGPGGRSDTAAARRTPALDDVFGALSDPIRRGIVARLAQGPCSVTGLGEPYQVSAPAISKHLAVLERSGLIHRWKIGRVHYCRLVAAPLDRAGDWIERHRTFWEEQLDALAEYVDGEQSTCSKTPPAERVPHSKSGAASARRAKPSSVPGPGRKP